MQRVFLGEAYGAVDRMGDAGSAAGRLGGADLGDGDGESGQRRVRLDESGFRSDAGSGRLFGEHRKLLLDGLKSADRATKLRALTGVCGSHLQQRLRGAGDLRGTQQRTTQ
ncbi:hypothetical protein D3C78_1340750 [compost metagenome]